MSELNQLPAVSSAQIPARVRAEGRDAEQAYRAALGFERALVGQLTRQLERAKGAEDEESGTAATNAYRDMLPATLADAVTQGGGIGLAEDLYRALRPEAS